MTDTDKMKELERQLTACFDLCSQEGSGAVVLTRQFVTEQLTRILKELKIYYSVPVDFSLEIDDNNNSIIIHFAKDYTTDDQD